MNAKNSIIKSSAIVIAITLSGCAMGGNMVEKIPWDDMHEHCDFSQSNHVKWFMLEEAPDSEWALEDLHDGYESTASKECEQNED